MFHHASEKRLSGKVVLAGPHKSGKSTLLQQICATGRYQLGGSVLHMHVRERVVALNGDAVVVNALPAIDVHDEVYGYDLVPIIVGPIAGVDLSFTLYALPGHPDAHDAIDRMWRGVDVLVFVADSRRSAIDENLRSWDRIRNNPWFDPKAASVLLLNRRDAPDALAAKDLVEALGWKAGDPIEVIASQGVGIPETMTTLAKAVTRAGEATLAASRS